MASAKAFTRACVGYVHCIAHTLGGLYGTPHGLANAVILPYVMEEFGPAVYFKLARLAEAVFVLVETVLVASTSTSGKA